TRNSGSGRSDSRARHPPAICRTNAPGRPRPPGPRHLRKNDMSIDLSAPPVPFSFELYPPRSPAREAALHETIRRLAAAGPRFISVTYGAGGSVGGRSLEVLRHILTHTAVPPLAHLTCVGN